MPLGGSAGSRWSPSRMTSRSAGLSPSATRMAACSTPTPCVEALSQGGRGPACVRAPAPGRFHPPPLLHPCPQGHGPGIMSATFDPSTEERLMTRALIVGSGGAVAAEWQAGLAIGLLRGGVDLRRADVIVSTSAGYTVAVSLAFGRDPATIVPVNSAAIERASAPPDLEAMNRLLALRR